MNKQEALDRIPLLLASMQRRGMLNENSTGDNRNVKFAWHETVDGNPRAAYSEAHPYTGNVTVSGYIGINGKKSGNGTFGD